MSLSSPSSITTFLVRIYRGDNSVFVAEVCPPSMRDSAYRCSAPGVIWLARVSGSKDVFSLLPTLVAAFAE
jgi:hypothetical protein